MATQKPVVVYECSECGFRMDEPEAVCDCCCVRFENAED